MSEAKARSRAAKRKSNSDEVEAEQTVEEVTAIEESSDSVDAAETVETEPDDGSALSADDAAGDDQGDDDDSDDDLDTDKEAQKAAKAAAREVKRESKAHHASKQAIERKLKKADEERKKAERARRKADFQRAMRVQADADLSSRQADHCEAKADALREKAIRAREQADESATLSESKPNKLTAALAQRAEQRAQYLEDCAAEANDVAAQVRKRAKRLNRGKNTASRKVETPGSRQWVPPTFITVGLLGVAWLVVYYVTAATGIDVPYLTELAGWNILIGMGLIASAFGIATLWK